MIYYPKPMHVLKAFERTVTYSEKCDVTEQLCQTVLSLPIGPYIKKDEQDMVTDAIINYVKNHTKDVL